MSGPAFTDKAHRPTDADIEALIGRAAAGRWRELVDAVSRRHRGVSLEMKYYGQKLGWSIFLSDGKRRLLYLGPRKGSFEAAVVLGEKAAARAHDSGLDPATLALLDSATKYVEGRAVRMDVASRAVVKEVLGLVDAKMAG